LADPHGGAAFAGEIAIGVGLDPQSAYEDALAMARAWLAFAAELERSGRVAVPLGAKRALCELAPPRALAERKARHGG
jgi:hypothetical protein